MVETKLQTKIIYHPAKFSDVMIPIFAQKLQGYDRILDPMAGTGKIARIRDRGWEGEIYCNDLEPEWVDPKISEDGLPVFWSFMDAAKMTQFNDDFFDAICTSPTYGNRLADHWNRKEFSVRHSYTFDLGHDLHPENTGKMHWGESYMIKHIAIWRECLRVLRTTGRLIINISNHIRRGKEIDCVSFHKTVLTQAKCKIVEEIPVKTARLGYGANNKARVDYEWILIFEKL
jgi:SAM-dependent methyltransferase